MTLPLSKRSMLVAPLSLALSNGATVGAGTEPAHAQALDGGINVARREPGPRPDLFISVKDTGAVGDGVMRPVDDLVHGIVGTGKRYGDLAAARDDVGRGGTGIVDLGLSDSLDWAAHQLAFNLIAAGGGGVVYTPPGAYLCNQTLTLPRQAKFRDGPGDRHQTVWMGAGSRNTVISWPVDLGPDRYAVFCEGRDRPNSDFGQHAPIRDLELRGPAAGLPRTLGVGACQMHGLALGPGRDLDYVRIRHFNHGLAVRGGQMLFQHVECTDNHISAYWETPLRNDFGDLLFIKCYFTGATLASIAVANDSTIGGSQFLSCYIGGAPYAILGEAGGEDRDLLSDCLFQSCQFEYVGNALLWDDNWDPAKDEQSSRRWSIKRARFKDCYYHNDTRTSSSNLLATGGRGRHYLAFLKHAVEIEFDGLREAGFAWQPGSKGFFSCTHASGMLRGDLDAVLKDCDAQSVRLFRDMENFPYNSVRLEARDWQGLLMRLTEADREASVATNDVIALGGDSGTIVRSQSHGESSRCFGVARSAAKAGEWFPVARSGYCKVNSRGKLSRTGVYLVPDLSPGIKGAAKEWSGAGEEIIGCAMNTNSSPDVMLTLGQSISR